MEFHQFQKIIRRCRGEVRVVISDTIKTKNILFVNLLCASRVCRAISFKCPNVHALFTEKCLHYYKKYGHFYNCACSF